MPIGHGNSFLVMEKSWKIIVEKEWSPCSNLRQITHECVYFRPHCKEEGHAIRSVISEKAMLYTNVTALSSIEPELLPNFYIAGIGNFVVTLTLTR